MRGTTPDHASPHGTCEAHADVWHILPSDALTCEAADEFAELGDQRKASALSRPTAAGAARSGGPTTLELKATIYAPAESLQQACKSDLFVLEASSGFTRRQRAS